MRSRFPKFFPVLVLSAAAYAQGASPTEAIALEQQGRWAEAVQVWQSVTEKNPRDAAAFASMGVDLAREQKYAEAASAYRRALKLNPQLPGIQMNLGLAEFKLGNFRAAVPPLAVALAADSNNGQAQTLLGLSYY